MLAPIGFVVEPDIPSLQEREQLFQLLSAVVDGEVGNERRVLWSPNRFGRQLRAKPKEITRLKYGLGIELISEQHDL
jgi:hypothetical protein